MNPANELVSIMTTALTSIARVPAISAEPPKPTRRLRPRKTHYPAPHRRGWHDLDDEADDLLTSNGVRLYHAEKALVWEIGYHVLDAKEALRVSILARYALEISDRKSFVSEVSATKPAASA